MQLQEIQLKTLNKITKLSIALSNSDSDYEACSGWRRLSIVQTAASEMNKWIFIQRDHGARSVEIFKNQMEFVARDMYSFHKIAEVDDLSKITT